MPKSKKDTRETRLHRIFAIVAKVLDVEESKLSANTVLLDLGMDDIDFSEIIGEVANAFEINLDELDADDDRFDSKEGWTCRKLLDWVNEQVPLPVPA